MIELVWERRRRASSSALLPAAAPRDKGTPGQGSWRPVREMGTAPGRLDERQPRAGAAGWDPTILNGGATGLDEGQPRAGAAGYRRDAVVGVLVRASMQGSPGQGLLGGLFLATVATSGGASMKGSPGQGLLASPTCSC